MLGAMTSFAAARSAGPLPLRLMRRLLVLLLLLAPLLLAALTIDGGPRAGQAGPPDAAAAARTRDVAASLQTLVASRGAAGGWSVSEDEMNAVLAAAQRLRPGLRGVAHVGEQALDLDLALGAPLLPRGLWLNLHLAFAPSEDGLRLASARLGRLPLPPGLVLAAAKLGADRLLGDGLGSEALASIRALRLAPPTATVVLGLGDAERVAFFERLRARALAAAGQGAREQAYVQLWHLDKAVRDGVLPREGSVLPYLDRAVRIALRQRDADPREAARAALYALALYCGDPAFGDQIGVTLRPELQGAANGCDGTTLAGRDDLKRHFVVSAGLHAATSGSAFGVGELKELLDSGEGGSGFSFADIVADAAGLRFAAALLATPPEDWRAMLDRIDGEADLMPPLDGLPEGLSEAEFRARFRDVDSVDYAAMVAEIERRLDALPLYAPEGP
jgi:hypothetical protein